MLLGFDIIRTLITHLQSNNETKTIFTFSLTCKAACGFALDALWYKMSSLVPLLKCLPDDVWRQGEAGTWVSLRTFCQLTTCTKTD